MRISLLVSSGFDGLLPLLDALGLSILNRIIASATSDRGTVYYDCLSYLSWVSLLWFVSVPQEAYPLLN